MTNLKFVNDRIRSYETMLLTAIDTKCSEEQIKYYEERLNMFKQIKAELEAWEFVKEEVGFAIENIEGSRSSNVYGCKYGLKCYGEGIIPLSDKEVESFKKALEVKD